MNVRLSANSELLSSMNAEMSVGNINLSSQLHAAQMNVRNLEERVKNLTDAKDFVEQHMKNIQSSAEK